MIEFLSLPGEFVAIDRDAIAPRVPSQARMKSPAPAPSRFAFALMRFARLVTDPTLSSARILLQRFLFILIESADQPLRKTFNTIQDGCSVRTPKSISAVVSNGLHSSFFNKTVFLDARICGCRCVRECFLHHACLTLRKGSIERVVNGVIACFANTTPD
jgi:hypothetical protein